MSALLLGHRGDSANHAENSPAAFQAALDCGADGVELDVQVSADGVPVVIHDATLERTTAGAGRVDAHTWAQLDALGVPALRDVLALLRGHTVAVELKPSYDAQPQLARTVLDMIDAGVAHDVLLFAFDGHHLSAARRIRSDVRCALLLRERPTDPRAARDAYDAQVLAMLWTQVDAALCEAVPVIAWTVDVAAVARALLDMGVVGLISNRPCALRAVVPRG